MEKIIESHTFYLADGMTEEMEEQLREALVETEGVLVARTQVQCKYEVQFAADYFSLRAIGDERPLCKRIAKLDGWEILLADRLAKVANYERSLTYGPRKARLNLEQEVEIVLEQVFVDGYGDIDESQTKTIEQDGSGVFAYQKKNGTGTLKQPRMRLKVRVKGNQYRNLYVGMLYFDEAFGIKDKYLPVDKIQQKEDFYKTYSFHPTSGTRYNYIHLSLPKHLVTEWGVTEIVNHLKVIVSEQKFPTDNFVQEELEQEPQQEMQARGEAGEDAKGNDIEKEEDDFDSLPRWNVKDISFTVQRSAELNDLPADATLAIAPASGLTFETALLESMSGYGTAEGSKSAEGPVMPVEVPFTDPVELLTTGTQNTRSAGNKQAIDTIKLCNVQGAETVSPDNPLRIRLKNSSKAVEEEALYVFAFDEELRQFYPVGWQLESGEVVIDYLPEPTPDKLTKSLGGAIKLYFRKVRKLYRKELERGMMREVTISTEGESVYLEKEAAAIKGTLTDLHTELNRPPNIAVFIHGITGDTTEMPGILARAKDAAGKPLNDRYDLVLTFDYESLNTSIMNTADHLLHQLKTVGLTTDHPHHLDLFAHSMGGLVSRCFIERMNRGNMIRRLIQFGTPNAGSPLVYAHGGVVLLLGQLLGGLFPLRWFLQKTGVAAGEMRPGSEFMLLLAAGDRGEVPYYLVNGDVTQGQDYQQKVDGTLKRFGRLFERDQALTRLFFKGKSNDAIVSVESQQSLLEAAQYQIEVDCDHMSYFQSPAAAKGLEAIFQAIDASETP